LGGPKLRKRVASPFIAPDRRRGSPSGESQSLGFRRFGHARRLSSYAPASLVHPREVWRAALHLCAAAVVFVHNHPSGDPAPSQEDQEITRRLKETGEMLGIRVLNHVVLGDDGRFFSFSDRGLL
jgi:hypothetical protein